MEKNSRKRSEWPGYSMDELLYQKALTVAHIEFTKERVSADLGRMRKGNVFLSGSWFSRIMKMFDYTDIFVIGIMMWKKLSPIFTRKKK